MNEGIYLAFSEKGYPKAPSARHTGGARPDF